MTSMVRADHVGSFLRPAELLDARHAQASVPDLQQIEDRHILRVLERQKEIGSTFSPTANCDARTS